MLLHNSPLSINHLLVLIFIAMCSVILSALAFEHLGGYIPCKLCLEQREPWYVGIPVMALVLVSVFLKWPLYVSKLLLAIVILLLVYSVFLGVHHSGVEWGFWEGPGDCGAVQGDLSMSVGQLTEDLKQSTAPSCTEASLRVLGLSFAGWNALASFVLAILSGYVFTKMPNTRIS